MSDLTDRLRARLITVPKPGTEPFTPQGPITMWISWEHKAGDDAGLAYLPEITTPFPRPARVQEHIYVVEPLCAEAAAEIERLTGENAAVLLLANSQAKEIERRDAEIVELKRLLKSALSDMEILEAEGLDWLCAARKALEEKP
jgi:hypothetical protein